MPGRKYNFGDYRYGFNGKESDTDGEFGSLTHYDYGFRIYNPAEGRFLSVDALTRSYPWYTPYQFAGNKPIIAIDLDGLEEAIVIRDKDGGLTALHVDNDKQVIDGIWTHYKDSDQFWKSGYDKFSKQYPEYTGTLLMDLSSENVQLSYNPDVTPQKKRNGITLMTGTGLRGEGNVRDAEGTSDVIVDDFLIPFGGGGGAAGNSKAVDILLSLVEVFTDWTSAAGGINPDRVEEAREEIDKLFSRQRQKKRDFKIEPSWDENKGYELDTIYLEQNENNDPE